MTTRPSNGTVFGEIKGVVLLAVALLSTTGSSLQAASSVAYHVQRSWTDKEGLPGSQVWAIAQDQDGYIWLGTSTGLTRFDGVRFDDPVGTGALPATTVRALCVSRDGSLWIGFGGTGGISRLRNGVVTNYDARQGIPRGLIVALVEDHDGTMWAASDAGVSRFSNGKWQLLDETSGLPGGAQTLFVDRRGTLWVGTSIGVFRRTDAEAALALFSSAKDVFAFSDDASGALWTTSADSGFRRLDSGDPVSRALGLQARGSRLHHDADGNLWVGSFGQGLFRVSRRPDSGVSADRLGVEDGLTSQVVWSVMTDREGSVWVGTQNGLNQLTRNIVTTVPLDGDVSMNRLVRGVAASNDGSIWIGTADGLYRFVGTAPTKFDQTHGLPSVSVLAVHAQRGGNLWVATTRGVAGFTKGRFVNLPLPPGVSLNRVNVMTTGASGDLWLSDSSAGLFRWNAGKLVRVSGAATEKKVVTSLLSDQQGRVWIGFLQGGLATYEDGTLRSYEQAEGLARGSITGLYEDADRTLWITANGGLSWFRGNRFRTADRDNGLPGNAVSAVTEDNEGYLWIGGKSGIVRVSKTEFNNIDKDPAHHLRLTFFGSVDGVRGNPIALGSPVARAPDGRLWFCTSDGVAFIDPSKSEKRRIPPAVTIQSVNANDDWTDSRTTTALRPLVHRLAIVYTAPSFLTPSMVRFRYRLEGYDKDWVDAGHQRQAVYTALPPGTYRFRVVAGSDGVWNDVGDDWAFSIAPMFYQTRWFAIVSVIGVAALIGAGWRLRARSLRAGLLLVLEERARVAREIHDTLLQAILGAALEIDREVTEVGSEHASTRRRLLHLRDQLQSSVREMRQAIWDLRSPILRGKQDLASALKPACRAIVAGAQGIHLEFSVSGTPRRAAQIDEQLFRLGQEAVRNAVRHAGASRVRVELGYLRDSISLRIIDDGHGFDSQGGQSVHWGLDIMEERAKKIGATLRVFSRPGAGSEIEAVAKG